jgi:hypothetical protein
MTAASTSAFRALAFGNVDGRLWGAAVQSGHAGLAFGSADSTGSASMPEWTVEDRAWSLTGEGFELHVDPRGETPAERDGDGSSDDQASAQVSGRQELCRVHGRISLAGVEQIVDCAGTRTQVDGLEADAIGSARVVSGWFGPDEAITVVALRSRRASDHEDDLIAATVFDPGGWVPVTDPRLSTTYTQGGDPARTSLELWVADGENEFPRRAAGEATGLGVAFSAGPLALRVAPMRCHSRGLDGAGVYVLASL